MRSRYDSCNESPVKKTDITPQLLSNIHRTLCCTCYYKYKYLYIVYSKGMRLLTTTFALAYTVRGFVSSSQRSYLARARARDALRMSSVSISDAFDGGNIQFVDALDEGDVTTVILRIKPDPYVCSESWFLVCAPDDCWMLIGRY